MKSIIVATDFSKGGENACSYARKLARLNDFKLIYVHIVNLPIVDPKVASSVVAETADDLREDAEKKLADLVAHDKTVEVTSEFRTAFNDIIGLINEISEEEKVELVVVGKTGQRTFFDRLLGSTAQGLINHVESPLLVIPEDFDGEILKRASYATKLEFDEEEYLENALSWSYFSNKPLILSHINKKHGLENVEFNEHLEAINLRFRKKGYVYQGFEAGSFTDGIAKFIEENQISLIFLTTQKRGLFEGIIDPSKTKALVNKLQIPVMVYSYNK